MNESSPESWIAQALSKELISNKNLTGYECIMYIPEVTMGNPYLGSGLKLSLESVRDALLVTPNALMKPVCQT